MKTLLPSLAPVVLSLAAIHAKTITVSFEAKIEGGAELNPRFAEKLKPGTIVTGMFTFDSETKDTHDDPQYGEYHFEVPKYRMIVNLANIPLESAPGKRYYIWNADNQGAYDEFPGMDYYVVGAEDILCPDPWLAGQTMFIQETDTTGKAIASTALLTKYPDPKNFEMHHLFINGGGININAEVTKFAMDDSLFKPVILILPAPGDFFQTQRIDPVVQINDVKPGEAKIERVLLDDVDVSERYLAHLQSGTVDGAKPGSVWILPSPTPSEGPHVFKVKVRFSSGHSSWGETYWNIQHASLHKDKGRSATNKGRYNLKNR